jgi:hypothetical protein
MSLYYRNLKRIGIGVILVSLGNLVYELLIRHYLTESGSPYLAYVPLPWGIWVKNMIGAASGFVALTLEEMIQNNRKFKQENAVPADIEQT